MLNKIYLNIIIIVSWLLAAALLFCYHFVFSFDKLLSTTAVFTAIDILCLFGSSLIINKLIIPKLLYKQKTLYMVFAYIALFFLYAYTVQFLQKAWFRHTGSITSDILSIFNRFTYQIFNTWFVIFLAGMCISFYRLIGDYWISQKRYQDLQRENERTELSFLKAQINPHFLFNSINGIYGKIDRANEEARDMVLKFSDMLRYQLYECNTDTIGIDKEIKYLVNYVQLQKLRKENTVIDLNIDKSVKGLDIAPLLFIPFVENAFKYVSNFDNKENKIDISMYRDNGSLKFHVLNTKETIQGAEFIENKGIGITNVKRRLELLYPGQHKLQIRKNESNFEVLLQIELQ